MKRVVIVGNGPLETDQSQVIDTADFVVRFNEAGNYGRHTGTRVDALCVTNLCDPGRRFARRRVLRGLAFLGRVREIWFPRPSAYFPLQCWFKPPGRRAFKVANYGRHMVRRNGLEDKEVVWFSAELYAAACGELHLAADVASDKAPSTGYLAIKYVLERFPAREYETVLLGFTFKGSEAHDWPGEEQAVRALQQARLVQWM